MRFIHLVDEKQKSPNNLHDFRCTSQINKKHTDIFADLPGGWEQKNKKINRSFQEVGKLHHYFDVSNLHIQVIFSNPGKSTIWKLN